MTCRARSAGAAFVDGATRSPDGRRPVRRDHRHGRQKLDLQSSLLRVASVRGRWKHELAHITAAFA
jgi:hypothetical protein